MSARTAARVFPKRGDADVAARTVAAPSELPIGIFTAAIGGPAFLAIMVRNNTWASGR